MGKLEGQIKYPPMGIQPVKGVEPELEAGHLWLHTHPHGKPEQCRKLAVFSLTRLCGLRP